MHVGEGVLHRCGQRRAGSIQGLAEELENFGFKISAPKESDKEILAYLLAYLEVTGFHSKTKTTLVLTDSTGPVLVTKSPGKLEIGKNAAHDLFSSRLHHELDKGADKDNGAVTVSFTNTLFEQLTKNLADADSIRDLIKELFGVSIEADPNSPEALHAHPLTNTEATMLLKQLIDLPLSVSNELKLKTVLRMRPGTISDAAADYNAATQTIRLFDGAFSSGIVLGEGTILHEMGHALWESLPDQRGRFTEISWENSPSGKKRIKDGRSDFVSDYARKSPEEDFAESFSSYVNQRELLEKKAPEKQLFLQEMLRSYFLDDSRYSAHAQEKAKTRIYSGAPDANPPHFKGKLTDLIKLKAKIIEDTGEIEIECAIHELHDDISGVKEGTLLLRPAGSDSHFGDECYIRWDESHCVNKEAGSYLVRRKFPRERFKAKSIYEPQQIWAEDKAKNEASIEIQGGEKILLDGANVQKERPEKGKMSA